MASEDHIMRIFLSWSGPTSKRVAEALRKWLPYMIQCAKPFISSGDINKGDTWSDVLADELKDADYGIICVTPYNVHRPWLIFEAGAMTHFVSRSRVTPLLFRVESDKLDKGPLAQFQSTDLGCRDDFCRLIFSINRANKAGTLDEELLEQNFDVWWEKLKEDLDKITRSSDETSTCYPWLKTFDDLSIHDQCNECHVIWFVTADVFKYAIAEKQKSKIAMNLDRDDKNRVEYRYLFPDRDDLKPFQTDLNEMRTKYHARFDYRAVKLEVFEQRAPSDFVMIQHQESNSAKVFVRAPIAHTDGDYWFEADGRAADGFFKRFKDLWENQSTVAADKIIGVVPVAEHVA